MQGIRWTPSKVIHRLGKEINHPESIYYWCYKVRLSIYRIHRTLFCVVDLNSGLRHVCWCVYDVFQNNIPVFSPALTDGSIGDMIYFHSINKPGLVIDIVEGNWLSLLKRGPIVTSFMPAAACILNGNLTLTVNDDFTIDWLSDIHRMNSQSVYAKHTGMIIIGGGLIKHHICNANLMVNT